MFHPDVTFSSHQGGGPHPHLPHPLPFKAQARELAESAGEFQCRFDPEVWEVVQDPVGPSWSLVGEWGGGVGGGV